MRSTLISTWISEGRESKEREGRETEKLQFISIREEKILKRGLRYGGKKRDTLL